MTARREAREGMTTDEAAAYARGWRDCWASVLGWVTTHSSPAARAQEAIQADIARLAPQTPKQAPEAAGGDPGASVGPCGADACVYLCGGQVWDGRQCHAAARAGWLNGQPPGAREATGLDYRGG